jgi:2-polyprenyl-3-methyl-5-hydroxy-6-metoxy-1,4-benzoquinol methylase
MSMPSIGMNRHLDDEAYMRAKRWTCTTVGQTNAALERLYRALRERFFPLAGEVVEIGFGGGGLLDFLKRSGYAVRGYEISDPLVELACANGFEAYNVSVFLSDDVELRPVDLIVSLDVFEHMDDDTVVRTLRAAARRLSPQGRVVVRTPNAASPLGVYYQFSDWTHRNLWSQPYAAHCAERAGLTLDRVAGEFDFPAARGAIGLALSLRNAFYKFIELFVEKTVYRGCRFRLSPNIYFVFLARV